MEAGPRNEAEQQAERAALALRHMGAVKAPGDPSGNVPCTFALPLLTHHTPVDVLGPFQTLGGVGFSQTMLRRREDHEVLSFQLAL